MRARVPQTDRVWYNKGGLPKERSGMNGKALILTDGKAGHENQSRAFARALGLDFELAPVRFKSGFHKALSYLFDRIGLRPT